MKKLLFFVIILVFITGCSIITGKTVEGISKEQAESVAKQTIREVYKSNYNIVYNSKRLDNYWVVQIASGDLLFVWVNVYDSKVECINKDNSQPVNCIT